jgi:hypothetical protein
MIQEHKLIVGGYNGLYNTCSAAVAGRCRAWSPSLSECHSNGGTRCNNATLADTQLCRWRARPYQRLWQACASVALDQLTLT